MRSWWVILDSIDKEKIKETFRMICLKEMILAIAWEEQKEFEQWKKLSLNKSYSLSYPRIKSLPKDIVDYSYPREFPCKILSIFSKYFYCPPPFDFTVYFSFSERSFYICHNDKYYRVPCFRKGNAYYIKQKLYDIASTMSDSTDQTLFGEYVYTTDQKYSTINSTNIPTFFSYKSARQKIDVLETFIDHKARAYEKDGKTYIFGIVREDLY